MQPKPLVGATLEAEAQEFIVAYYTAVVSKNRQVRKFYDLETGTIWRESLGSNVAVKLTEAQRILVPEIRDGSKVTITNYNVLPGEASYNLVVSGTIEFEGNVTSFVQSFVIAHKYDRIFIVSDSLVTGPGTAPSGEVVRVDLRRPQSGGRQWTKKRNDQFNWTSED